MRQKILLLAIGCAIGLTPYLIHIWEGSEHRAARKACRESYPLTSRDLDCEEFEESSARMKALDQTLNAAVDQFIADGKAEMLSVFVRDLHTRQWAAAHEFDAFIPASLLKVPIMIAYFRFAEIQPSILTEEIEYKPSSVMGSDKQDFLPETLLETGKKYTVDKLIEEMIVNSDNNAADLLISKMNASFFDNVLIELGINIPKNLTERTDFLTAKTYANVYRVLYNASYLNRNYSEKALEYLKRTPFMGLQASLPKDVVVANKFGERQIEKDGVVIERELHDCGIVYKNPNPYTICIMTEGKDFEVLRSMIQDISKMVYETM